MAKPRYNLHALEQEFLPALEGLMAYEPRVPVGGHAEAASASIRMAYAEAAQEVAQTRQWTVDLAGKVLLAGGLTGLFLSTPASPLLLPMTNTIVGMVMMLGAPVLGEFLRNRYQEIVDRQTKLEDRGEVIQPDAKGHKGIHRRAASKLRKQINAHPSFRSQCPVFQPA